jgi:hypothetical protein
VFGSKKGKVDLSQIRRAADREVLKNAVAHGDDLTQPRHTLLYFYPLEDDDRSGGATFDSVITGAEKFGLTPSRNDDDGLILEGHVMVDPDSINALMKWAENAADRAGVNFDGWECAIVQGKPN